MLLVACGCGRIGFDPSATDVNGATTDAAPALDGSTMLGEHGTCGTAADLAPGTSLANDMVDMTDDVTPWGLCPTGADVVYRVTVTAAVDLSITVTPSFNGVLATSRECPPPLGGTSSCYTMSANQPYQQTYTFSPGTTYVIVDKLSGSGTTFDISLQ